MSLRYEMPSDDQEENRKWAAERNAEWDALAAEATKGDKAFHRWKNRHWIIVWTLTLVIFGLLMWAAISSRGRGPSQPKAFAAPFAGASFVFGIGAWMYSNRVRKIAVAEWSRRRDEELKKKKG